MTDGPGCLPSIPAVGSHRTRREDDRVVVVVVVVVVVDVSGTGPARRSGAAR